MRRGEGTSCGTRTLAPRRATSRQISRPIAPPAPVTRTVLPRIDLRGAQSAPPARPQHARDAVRRIDAAFVRVRVLTGNSSQSAHALSTHPSPRSCMPPLISRTRPLVSHERACAGILERASSLSLSSRVRTMSLPLACASSLLPLSHARLLFLLLSLFLRPLSLSLLSLSLSLLHRR